MLMIDMKDSVLGISETSILSLLVEIFYEIHKTNYQMVCLRDVYSPIFKWKIEKFLHLIKKNLFFLKFSNFLWSNRNNCLLNWVNLPKRSKRLWYIFKTLESSNWTTQTPNYSTFSINKEKIENRSLINKINCNILKVNEKSIPKQWRKKMLISRMKSYCLFNG